MNNITWLSHGGPGSGRYPKGSGKNPRGAYRTLKRISKKTYKTKYDYDYKKMEKYLSNDQKKSLNKTESNYLNLDRKITDYKTGDYLKNISKKSKQEHIKKRNDHQKNAEKIANEILGKYGDKKIKVAMSAKWNGKRWVKQVFEEKSKDRLKFILSTLSHGGPGKDRTRSKTNLNKMGSKSFYNYINSSPKGSLPISIDRTDYIYKKSGIKRKSR